MPWSATQPYNELPLLPPKAEIETRAVLKRCLAARVALARLDESAEHLPNPGLLIHVIPVLEAQASSEIENIVTTTDKLFRSSLAQLGEMDAATKEAQNYRQALYQGLEMMDDKPLCTGIAQDICSAIKDQRMEVRKVPGTVLRSHQTGENIYTPPVGEERIRGLLSNWEKFMHADDLFDPLVMMALAHYQFEAIHPFVDGNGRTGRVLNLLYLVHAGVLKSPILYHSGEIVRRKQEYYERLLNVSAKDEWERWIIFMLEVTEASARLTNDKISSIRALRVEVKEKMKRDAPKVYSSELLDVLFNQPYCRISNVVNAGIAKRQTASTYLKKLEEIGLLRSERVGRDQIYVHEAFLEVLR